MKRPVLLLPALALAVSFAVSGCGGSDDSISHDDFVKQADKICADGDAEINAAADELGDAPTEEQIATFITDTVVPNTQDQHDAIEDLGAPEGDEDDVDAMLTALQDGIDALKADPAAAPTEPFDDANTAAKSLGLTDCGASS